MGINKVIYYGEVLVDMSQVSVNPETLVTGETALDATGELITGKNPYEKNATDSEVNNQSDLLDQAIAALQGKAAGGGGEGTVPVIEPLDITENGTYTAPVGVDGYSPVTVDVPIPEGYIVPEGILEVTENGEHDVTEYASVNVSVASSGGSDDQIDKLLSNSLEDLDSNATSVRAHMFRGSSKLKTVNLPEVKSLGDYAFYSAGGLETVNLPKLETAGSQIFYTCNKLKSMVLPSLVSSGTYLFRDCTYIEYIDLPKLTSVEASMFNGCRSLTVLALRSTTLVPLENTNAFTNCYRILGTKNSGVNPNGEKCGFIYVPAALIPEYQAAGNWSSASLVTQFRALEDYTVDGTITGEIDFTKI